MRHTNTTIDNQLPPNPLQIAHFGTRPGHHPGFTAVSKVTKTDFVLALRRLGFVLTHGQATSLAAEHHGDYGRFFAGLGDPRRVSKVSPGRGHVGGRGLSYKVSYTK